MSSSSFNPINFLVSLAVGWFLLAFLHALALSLFSSGGSDLVQGFRDIAFFHNRKAVLINVSIILVLGFVTRLGWYLAHRV